MNNWYLIGATLTENVEEIPGWFGFSSKEEAADWLISQIEDGIVSIH